MAAQSIMKNAVGRIAVAFHQYATKQGWKADDYRILVEVKPEWGRIHVVFVAREFPGTHPEDQWLSVIEFLDATLADSPELLESLNLTLRTFDQVQQGGLYSLSPDYIDVDELNAKRVFE